MSMATEAILLSVAMAVAAGLVGSFAVMRRMALAADALSHVALPGIGIALALHVHPLVGAVAMLFFGALLVWALEERSRATTETVIGVVFSAALALGSLMTTGEDLIEALFGGAGVLNSAEIAFGFVAAGAVVAFMITQRNRLIVMLVSPDVARTAGIDVQQLNPALPPGFRPHDRARPALPRGAPHGGAAHHSGRDGEALGAKPERHAGGGGRRRGRRHRRRHLGRGVGSPRDGTTHRHGGGGGVHGQPRAATRVIAPWRHTQAGDGRGVASRERSSPGDTAARRLPADRGPFPDS